MSGLIFLIGVFVVAPTIGWAQEPLKICSKTDTCRVTWKGVLEEDVSHYLLYYGSALDRFDHPESPFRIEAPREGVEKVEEVLRLVDGDYYFALSVVDRAGNEGAKRTRTDSGEPVWMRVDKTEPGMVSEFDVVIEAKEEEP